MSNHVSVLMNERGEALYTVCICIREVHTKTDGGKDE